MAALQWVWSVESATPKPPTNLEADTRAKYLGFRSFTWYVGTFRLHHSNKITSSGRNQPVAMISLAAAVRSLAQSTRARLSSARLQVT